MQRRGETRWYEALSRLSSAGKKPTRALIYSQTCSFPRGFFLGFPVGLKYRCNFFNVSVVLENLQLVIAQNWHETKNAITFQ
jgi:hypothetical protein